MNYPNFKLAIDSPAEPVQETIDPNCPLKLTPPAYKRIRKAVGTMMSKTGGTMKPIGLAPLFFGYLQAHCPSKMNRLKARNMAEVFTALLNEAYLCTCEHGGKKPKEWFYMTNARWEKHLLNKRNCRRYVRLLAHMRYIATYVGQHPLIPGNKVTFYKIDADALEDLANGILPRCDRGRL